MSKIAPEAGSGRSIRQLAEERLSGRSQIDIDQLDQDGIRRVIYELEVHQVELEIQNRNLDDAQREAELSRSRFQHLYESAPIGYLTLDAEGEIVSANPTTSEMLKRPQKRLLGQKLSSFIAAPHQDGWHFARRALMESGERRSLELTLVLDDASTIEVGLTASRMVAGPDTINLGLLDLTDLRKSERALRKAAAAASLAEQRERRKLASELHDDAGQLVSLASIKLRGLERAADGLHAEAFAELTDLLAKARDRITSLSFQLSPPMLHDVGLLAAIRWLAEDLGKTFGLKVTVVEAAEIPLDEASKSTLYQGIRELLINVRKHASIDEARVQIERDGSMVRVSVEDQGIGFEANLARGSFGRVDGRGGFGLLALRERLGQLGGSLEVGTGQDGIGSRVVIFLPLFPIDGDSQ